MEVLPALKLIDQMCETAAARQGLCVDHSASPGGRRRQWPGARAGSSGLPCSLLCDLGTVPNWAKPSFSLYYKMGVRSGSNDGKPEKRMAQCSRGAVEIYGAVGMTVIADGMDRNFS